jgi:hypothetical protein
MRFALALTSLAVLCALPAAHTAAQSQNVRAADAPGAPAPALNHVYVVLDAATFAAVRDSTELAALLGRTDAGLPDYDPPAPDADRVFFRGRETYLEFFAPDNRFGEPVGKVGLALGNDDPDDLDALERTWRETCPTGARRTPVEYRRAQPPVPWYDAMQCDETAGGDHLALWAMAYRPQFHRWQSGLTGEAQTSRARILAPRAEHGQGRFDIVRVHLQVDPDTSRALVRQLEDVGFAKQVSPSGILLQGDDWELSLRVSDETPRLLAIDLATDSPPPERLTLGSGALQRSGPRQASLRPNDDGDE